MQKRKLRESHNKSRNGCRNCKKRHVKCDEQGPPCANCIVRKIACVYQSPPDSGPNHKTVTSLTRRPKTVSANEPRGCSPGSSPVLVPRPSIVVSPVFSLSTSPAAFSRTSESHRLLELELMHRWSTRTYIGFCSIPEDQERLQTYLPCAALSTQYLMNGILAIAALDLARTAGESSAQKYLLAALEYSNKASTDFRAQLCDINRENLHLLYYFSSIAAVFNFAMPSEQLSTMDRLSMGFDMMMGAFNIAMTNIQWLLESNFISLSALLSYGTATMDTLDTDTIIALDQLTSVSQQIHICESKAVTQNAEQDEPLSNELDIYRSAIALLKYCFAEDARGLIKGYCLSLITAAGPDFALALKRLEPMALFIVMHFGVLLDRAARDAMAWWIASMGKDIVKVISEILQKSPIAQIPDGCEGISWTRQQVGLV